jgi:hypothetical protein
VIVVLLESSTFSTEELLSSVSVTIRFLVTSLTKALLPRLSSLAELPALGRVLVVPFKNDGGHCVLGVLQLCRHFWYPSPDLCLNTILSLSSTDNYFDLMAWFLQQLWTLCGEVCAFPNNVQSIEFTTAGL